MQREPKALMNQLPSADQFLEICKGLSIPVEIFTVERIGSNKSYSQENTVSSSYKLKLKIPMNIGFANKLIEIIKENEFDASYDVDYFLSNKNQIHQELIQEAILNSKKEAEKISESIGMTVIGIERAGVDLDNERHRGVLAGCILPESSYANLNALEPTPSEGSEAIDVMWLIEAAN